MIHKILAKKKEIHLSIFMVILWVNLLSILMVSGFNYFVFHRMSDDAYLESFIEYNHRVTEMAFRNIDKQIMQAVFQIPQFYFSPVQENAPLLRLQEEGVSSQEISAFATEMRKIQKSYPFVVSMDLYFEGTNTVVTGFDRVHFPETEEYFHQYLPWYQNWEKENITQGFLEKSAGAYLMQEPVITYVQKVSQPKWQGKSIVLAIHISSNSFGEYINEDEGTLAILTKDGQMLYDTEIGEEERLSVESVLAYAEQSGEKWGEGDAPISMKLGNSHITVFRTVSSVSSLNYLYQIENSRFYSEYNATKQIFVMNFLISIGFNLLMLALISYYNYSAYRKRVLKASRDAGLFIEQDNQSFNRSLNMLTKEISTLHKTINSSKGLLFQSAVRSIMLNKNPDEAYDKLAPYLNGDCVCTFFLYLPEEEDRKLSVERLQDEFEPGMRGYNVLFTTVEKVSLVAILLCEEEGKEEAKSDFIKEMDAHWNRYTMASGSMLSMQKDGIWNSYKSTVEISKYCYIFTQEKWLTYEILEIEKRKGDGSHLRLFEIMERDIKSENFLDFKSRLEGLIISFKCSNYTIDYCNSTLRDLVGLFYQIMQQNQLDMWVVFGYDIREYYKQVPDIDAFHEWGNYLCETIIRNIRQKKQSVDTDMEEKIAVFIEENLERNISLDLLSDHLHLRADVASRMFRQTMGKGYTEYVKERKLSYAIELMERGESIKDIAERLGYSSAQYFIKVFKESYGTTPYQYKKNREKEQETDGTN